MKSKTRQEGTPAPRAVAVSKPRKQGPETRKTHAPAVNGSERRYRRLLETAQAGLLILDSRTGRIEDVNPYLTKLLGYSPAELLGKKLWEIGIFQDPAAGKSAFRALQDNASFRQEDLPLRTKQGGQVLVEFLSSHFIDRGERMIKCDIRQMTSAAQTEQALHPIDEHFRLLFENMFNGYAHCRMIYENGRPSDFVYLHVNQAFQSLTGLKDVVGRRVTEVIPGIQNTNPELLEAYARVASTGKAESLEAYVEALKTWFSVSAYSLKKGEFVAVFDNITGRKGAQDALRESEEKYRGLVTEISEGIFVTDDHGVLTFANPALARILALNDPRQVLGRKFMEFVAPSASKAVTSQFGKAIATGQTSETITVDIVRADGTYAVVEIRPVPIMADGKIAGTRGVLRDITERKRAEQALEESEAHLRGLFEDSPISLWEQDFSLVKQRLDALGQHGVTNLEAYFETHPEVVGQCAALVRVLDVNKATLTVYGADRKQDLLGGLAQVLEGSALQDFRHELIKIAAGEFHINWQGRNKTMDGRLIDVDLNWSVVPGYEKSLSRVIVAAVDITERKRAEQALRAAEEKYRAIFENSIDGVFQSTLEGRFLTVNPAFARMLGYGSPQEMIAAVTDIARQVYVESPRRNEFVSSMAEQGTVTAFEFQMRRKDGSTLWVSENVRAVRDAEGGLLYYEGTVVDVTARKRAEDALRESEERMHGLFDNAMVGMYRTTPDGRILLANPAAVHVLGFDSFEDLAKRNLEQGGLYADYPRSKFRETMQNEGTVIGLEQTWRRKDGASIFIRESATAVRDPHGNVLYYDGTFEDITERKQAQILEEAVYRIASAAEATGSLDDLYPEIHQIISSVMPAENFFITIYDAARDMLQFPYFKDVNDEPFVGGIQPGKGLTAYILRTGKSLLCTQAVHDELERRGEVKLLGAPSAIWLGVPLIVEGKTIGAMVVQHYSDPTAYGEREQHMLEFVSTQIALAINRKQTEEARQEGERRFREMLENAALIAVMLDSHGCVTFCNDYLLQLTGRSRAEVLGQNWFAKFVPTDSPIANVFSEGMQRDTIVPHFENEILTASGARRTVSWNNTVLRDTEGRVIGTASLGEDITERKQGEDAVRRRADELAALQSTLLEITAPHDLNTLLQTITERAAQLIGGRSAGLYLCDPERKEVRCVVSYNTPRDFTGTILKYGDGAAGTVAQTGEPLVIDDYRVWSRRAGVYEEEQPFTAVLSAPMIWQNRVTGVIDVLDDVESRRFTATDLALLTLFANHAAIAVANTRLYEEAQKEILERKQAEEVIRRRADEFAALYETTLGLSAQYELSALLQTVAANAVKLLKSDSATMYLYDAANDELELMVQAGVPLPLGTRLKMGEGMAGRVAQSREPLIVDDYQIWESRSALYDGIPFRAVAQVPMLSGGNLIGVLAVTQFGESSRKFTAADVRLLSLFASPAASAVENASLYENAQKEILERKQAEEASRKAEEKYRSIFDNSPEEITQTTPEGRFIGANPAAVRMMGYESLEELIAGFSDLAGKFYVQPGRRQEFVSLMEKHGTISGYESEVYRRDGGTRWILENSRVVRRADGSVAYYEGTAQDITERKQAQILQEAVYRIASAAEGTGSLDDLYPQIHRTVSSVMPAENFYITIYDAARDMLQFPYFKDVNDEPFVGGIQPGKGLTAYVLRTGKSLLCTQAVHDELERLGDVKLLGVPSAIWLGVPLIVEGKTIGAMVVQHYSDPTAYGEREQHMLEFVSTQVALAINRKQAEEFIRRRADEFAALYQMTHGLTANYELSALLQSISDNAVKLLKSNSAAMYLYDAATDELELAVKTGFPAPVGIRLKMGEGMAGRVAQSREPLIVDDYQAWQSHSSLYDGIPFRAVAEVPMLHGGALIGVLAATELGESLRKFTEADVRLLSLFASPAAIAVTNARLFEEAQKEIAERKRSEQKTMAHLRRLGALRSIDTAISSTFDLRVTLNFLLQQVTLELGVDAAAVLVLDRDIQELTCAADRGFRGTGITRLRLRLGQDYAGRAALERRSIYVPNISLADPPGGSPGFAKEEGFVAYYAAPLIAKGQVKGVLEVFHRSSLNPDSDWTDFLETLAAQTAIAMDNDELFGDLQQSNAEMLMAYDRTIEGWSRAMDLRDRETEGHTLRVTDLTLELARRMQIKESELPHIRRGALLHDIGKLGVPDSILLKPDKLTPEEWVIMRQHPTHAYEMLSPIAYLRAAIDIPYCHHEKWDGTGYPRGLHGEEIPLDARIFAVVDVWDALTSDRPYRAAWSKERALEYITSESGKHFDPEAVRIFLEAGIADRPVPDSSS